MKKESKFKQILENYKDILEEFAEEQKGEFKYIFAFCDDEMKVDKRDYYKILALNLFFEFFNCIDLKDISFDEFYKVLKFDIKNNFGIFEFLIDNDKKSEKEKKEIILKYLDYYNKKEPIFPLMSEIGMF